jgi:hypothetical protein
MNKARLLPTGECWCGCGAETRIGSFFLQGHDKTAESRAIELEYGSVPDFLYSLGFAPGGKRWAEVKQAPDAEEDKRAR